MNAVVITYNIGKRFGLDNVGERRLQENIAVGLEGKALNPINPSTYGTYIRGPTMVMKW